MRTKLAVGILVGLCLAAHGAWAQVPPPVSASSTVVFWEEGFPAADSAAPSRAELSGLFEASAFTGADQLSQALGRSPTQLLVLPYGSAFPADKWPAIYGFLEHGGNLLVLGGQPFTRPAYREGNEWKLRPATTAYAQKLFINEYEATPGSQNLKYQRNEEFRFLDLPAFEWKSAWSLKIRLSDEDLNPRSGAGGMIDARLDALAWGLRDGRKVSAPIVQIDHLENSFASGRWMLLPCDLPIGFYGSSAGHKVLFAISQQALEGAEDFRVQPAWPLFLPGEPVTLTAHWRRFHESALPVRVGIERCPADMLCQSAELQFPLAVGPGMLSSDAEISLPPAPGKELQQRITARLYVGDKLRAIYNTGYWIRDPGYLRAGPSVAVNENFFEFDGHPRLIVGTTYMASDVQRQFFMQPNPYVWDRDMAEIQTAGFNMLRTGWWTAWDQITRQPGVVHEEMLRAFEAYLMTARKHRLPVQFTFFAFTPEVLGGRNPYLDTEALRRQKELILAFIERFKDVPSLMWDLINEPSFDNPNRLWSVRPNGDSAELKAWNAWLAERYKTRAEMAEAWNATPVPEGEPVPLPRDDEFSPRAVYGTMRGANSLKVHDFYLFAQEQFRNWVREIRSAIRATGSKQLITVGQDEAGVREGLNPAFFSDPIDFTSMHPWWQLDALLWDALTAKQPGKALLEQEVGIGRQLRIDGSVRRSADDEAALLERKMAIAMATGAGAIHWLWNINSYMRDDNEVSIGAVRPDGTEKPEADVLRRFAAFAATSGAPNSPPELPEVAVVTSQAFQYSALSHLALEAQMKAVRALEYDCHIPAYVIAENQIAKLGQPKLVILPSPQALSETTWQALLKYVFGGGNLLITGSMERDESWKVTHRLAALGIISEPVPLKFRDATIFFSGMDIELFPNQFNAEAQEFLDGLHTSDQQDFRKIQSGRGSVFLVNLPVELAEGVDSASKVYRFVLQQAGIAPPFQGSLPWPGVLVRPAVFSDRILYLFSSETSRDTDIQLRDKTTGAEIHFRLAALRSHLIVLRRPDGKVLAEYGNEHLLRDTPAASSRIQPDEKAPPNLPCGPLQTSH